MSFLLLVCLVLAARVLVDALDLVLGCSIDCKTEESLGESERFLFLDLPFGIVLPSLWVLVLPLSGDETVTSFAFLVDKRLLLVFAVEVRFECVVVVLVAVFVSVANVPSSSFCRLAMSLAERLRGTGSV